MRFMFYGRRAGWATVGGERLCAGLNELPDSAWNSLQSDPSVQRWIEGGHIVITHPAEGEPAPAPEPVVSVTEWTPTQAQLVSLTGIGTVSAQAILAAMPDGGFTSEAQMLALNHNIDTTELAAIFGD